MMPFRPGLIWMVLQNFSLAPFTAMQPLYLARRTDGRALRLVSRVAAAVRSISAFSRFTYITSVVARQQADAREEQRRLNSELRATRTLLAESSRIAERMRISRELHDLVGHHLTALSLNLEVASHLANGAAQDHVQQAQSVAKLLLADVREVVSQLREDDSIDLTEALKTLIEGVPGIAHPSRTAAALLRRRSAPRAGAAALRAGNHHQHRAPRRRAQSVAALRAHAGQRTGDARARRRPRRHRDLKHGNGLIGMRERLAQIGGRLNITTERDRGFALDAWLPLEATR